MSESSHRELQRCNNQLQELPNEIGNLTNLQELCINNNQLKEFYPEDISNPTNLQGLYPDINQLKESPKETGNLMNLGLRRGVHSLEEVEFIESDSQLCDLIYERGYKLFGIGYMNELLIGPELEEWTNGNEVHYAGDKSYMWCIISNCREPYVKIIRKYSSR